MVKAELQQNLIQSGMSLNKYVSNAVVCRMLSYADTLLVNS